MDDSEQIDGQPDPLPGDGPAGTGPSAEERTTTAAAGAPAGDQDLDDLLAEPDAASG